MRYLHYVIIATMGGVVGTTFTAYQQEPVFKFGFIIAMVVIGIAVNWISWHPHLTTAIESSAAGQMLVMMNIQFREIGQGLMEAMIIIALAYFCYIFHKEEERRGLERENNPSDGDDE